MIHSHHASDQVTFNKCIFKSAKIGKPILQNRIITINRLSPLVKRDKTYSPICLELQREMIL